MNPRSSSISADASADGFDWAATPLGPIATWSADLRAAVERATQSSIQPEVQADELTPAVILDALFDAASIGLGVLDRDLRLVRVNTSLAEINGIPREAHIGKRPTELVPGIPELEAVMVRLRELLETGETWRDVELRGATPASTDTQRIWIEEFFPIRADGRIVGLGGVVTEVTERRRVEEALRASEALFRQFAIASSDVLWVRNIVTQEFEFMSPAVAKLFRGSTSMPMDEIRTFDWMEAILPEDREATVRTLAQVRQGHPVVHDYRVCLPASRKVRWLRNTAFPLRDPDGAIRRIGGIVQDVTEQRRTADRLTVLIGELQHRTRNLMGVVQAMVETTLANSMGMDDFAVTFAARIGALARVQNLLSRHEGQGGIAFDELLRCELDAIGALPEQDGRVVLNGPDRVPLRSGVIQTLALAIHELMTNSLKHGALAQPAARLCIGWWLAPAPGGDGGYTLHIDWRESGVAMAVTGRVGQGRELIEHALPYQLNAATRFTLTEDGLHCTIALPLPPEQVVAS